ncbi:hypothetical protein [Microlunatus sp. GCM10028923]|uniref:hypothetical protein n=1 Tax=Microlunatus sp. GCM10028923 TaxID=3273400 RepID=UPI003609DF24
MISFHCSPSSAGCSGDSATASGEPWPGTGAVIARPDPQGQLGIPRRPVLQPLTMP